MESEKDSKRICLEKTDAQKSSDDINSEQEDERESRDLKAEEGDSDNDSVVSSSNSTSSTTTSSTAKRGQGRGKRRKKKKNVAFRCANFLKVSALCPFNVKTWILGVFVPLTVWLFERECHVFSFFLSMMLKSEINQCNS